MVFLFYRVLLFKSFFKVFAIIKLSCLNSRFCCCSAERRFADTIYCFWDFNWLAIDPMVVWHLFLHYLRLGFLLLISGTLRPILAHQVCNSSPVDYGCHKRYQLHFMSFVAVFFYCVLVSDIVSSDLCRLEPNLSSRAYTKGIRWLQPSKALIRTKQDYCQLALKANNYSHC